MQSTAQSRANLGARSSCSCSCPAKFFKSPSLEIPQPLFLQSINHFHGGNFFPYALLEFAFLCCLPSACRSCLPAVGKRFPWLGCRHSPGCSSWCHSRSSSPCLQLPSCSVPSLLCHLACSAPGSALWIPFSCHPLLLDSTDATHTITFFAFCALASDLSRQKCISPI